MAYYKVRIEVWCDWNPAESDLEEMAQGMGVGDAICMKREVIASSIARKTSKIMTQWPFWEDKKTPPTESQG